MVEYIIEVQNRPTLEKLSGLFLSMVERRVESPVIAIKSYDLKKGIFTGGGNLDV